MLSPAFKAFRLEHPDIKLVLKDVAEEQIPQTLTAGDADFGIGTCFALEESSNLAETPLFDDRFIVLCSKDHSLALKEQIAWSELQDQPFIALAPASPIRKLIDDTANQQGVRLAITNEVSFATTVLSLVSAGVGVSVLPINNHPYLPAFDVHSAALTDPIITRKISIFTQKNRSLSPASSAFIEFLKKFVKTKGPC